MRSWRNRGGGAHLRNVEEVRHQRPPACEPRPAEVAHRRLLGEALDRRPDFPRILGIEHETVRQAPQALRASRTSPPRHQTSVGRLESRSAATALFRYVGGSPSSDDRRRDTRTAGAGLSPYEIRTARTPTSVSCVSALAASCSRRGGPDDDDGGGQRHAGGACSPRRQSRRERRLDIGRTPPRRRRQQRLSCVHSQRPPAAAVARHQRVGFGRPPLTRLVGRNRRGLLAAARLRAPA